MEKGVYHVEYVEGGANITITGTKNNMMYTTKVFVDDECLNGYEQCLQDFGYRRSFINI